MHHVRWFGGLCSIFVLLVGCARPAASPALALATATPAGVPVGERVEIAPPA